MNQSTEPAMNKASNMVAAATAFARAKKSMNIDEFKTFVCCLDKIQWTGEKIPGTIYLDKRELAEFIGAKQDPVNLARNLRMKIGNLVDHSIVEFTSKDKKSGREERWLPG